MIKESRKYIAILKDVTLWMVLLLIFTVSSKIISSRFPPFGKDELNGWVTIRQSNQVKIGMTLDEVERLLGKPKEITTWGKDNLLKYKYHTGTIVLGQTLTIDFGKDNKVEYIRRI